eukprot:tig00000808_g4426.t1
MGIGPCAKKSAKRAARQDPAQPPQPPAASTYAAAAPAPPPPAWQAAAPAAAPKVAKVLVLYYSTYGHMKAMCEAAAEGAKSAGALVSLKRVPETLPREVLEKMGALEAQTKQASIPVADPAELVSYDAIILGCPTRFGGQPSQIQSFLDATGALWAQGKLVGKVASVITSSGTQHGGQESTILNVMPFFLHHGLAFVGLPYAFQGQMGVEEVKGGSPYGASTIAGASGERMPSAVELDAARFQGRHVAGIALKLKPDEKLIDAGKGFSQ